MDDLTTIASLIPRIQTTSYISKQNVEFTEEEVKCIKQVADILKEKYEQLFNKATERKQHANH